MPLWSFTGTVNPSRASELLAIPDFEHVLHLLQTATVVCFRWKEFENDRLRGCYRAEFVLRVHEDVYDALFNAPVGLRAQYAQSTAHGEAANRRAIDLLAPRLLEFEASTSAPSRTHLMWSLAGTQAKIWIDEKEAELQLGRTQADIDYEPWAANSATGVGLLAPRATRLEVKGGWLDPSGLVTLDPWKARRSEDIHSEGFS